MRTRRVASAAPSLGPLFPSAEEVAAADVSPAYERGKNEEQLQFIRHEAGPLCVLAAAGSGKTSALVSRVARLVDRGVDPERILCVTFSKKAADEMNERVRKLGIAGAEVRTWHALCRRVIRETPTREARWETDDKDRAKSYVKQAIGYKHENWVGADATKVRNFIGRCKANLWAPESGEALALARTMFGSQSQRAVRVYSISQHMIEDAGLLPFDDMLVVVAKLFAEDEDARLTWAGKFDYVMTDECQDNSRAQEVLQEAFARDHRNIVVVGDLAQSVYSFRGAEPELLARFAAQWGAETIAMHRNYRSGSSIIEAANAVIREGKYKLPVDMLAARSDAGEGKVEILPCDTLEDEASEVVSAAQAHLAAGGKLSDWYVLVRLNAQSRALEDALLRARLPYIILGGISFYERKEVKDLLGYLRVALGRDPEREAVKRCVNAPFRFLGARFVERLMEILPSDYDLTTLSSGLRSTISSTGIQRRQADSALDWLRLVEDVGRMVESVDGDGKPAHGAAAILEEVVRRTRYIEWLEKEEGEESVESSHAANVRELLRVAREFKTAGELLDYIEKTIREGAAQRKKQSGDLLTIMSVHKSKGLERSIVWLCGCNEGVLPHAKGDVEEERRIMYVATTRARDRLVVSYVGEMATRSGVRPMAPSRFLDAFPKSRADESGEHVLPTDEAVVEDAYGSSFTEPPIPVVFVVFVGIADLKAAGITGTMLAAASCIIGSQESPVMVDLRESTSARPVPAWLADATCFECGRKVGECAC